MGYLSSGVDYEKARKDIAFMLHSWVEEAKSENEQLYLKNELNAALEAFFHNPCKQTAIRLLTEWPDFAEWFEMAKKPWFRSW